MFVWHGCGFLFVFLLSFGVYFLIVYIVFFLSLVGLHTYHKLSQAACESRCLLKGDFFGIFLSLLVNGCAVKPASLLP